ncbi:MAG: ABC transporter permease [Promethearchaeota archaeon]
MNQEKHQKPKFLKKNFSVLIIIGGAFLVFLFFLLLFYLPLMKVFEFAVNTPTQTEDVSFWNVIGYSLNLRALQFSFLEALVSTLGCLFIGIPIGIFLGHFKFMGRRTVLNILTIPFVLPPTVVLLGFIIVLGDGGWINSMWMFLSGTATPLFSIYGNFMGIIIVHIFYNISIAVQLIIPAWQQVDFDLVDVARSLGASPAKIFFKIILPQLKNAILSAALLIFIYTFNSFAIVLFLGNVRFQTLEVRIYKLMKVGFDFQAGTILAILQIAINLLFLGFYSRISRKSRGNSKRSDRKFEYRTFQLRQSRSSSSVHFSSSSRTSYFLHNFPTYLRILFVFFLGLLLSLIILPILAIFISAFTPIEGSSDIFYGFRSIFSTSYVPLLGASTLRIMGNTLYFALFTVWITSAICFIILFIYRWKYRALSQYRTSSLESVLTVFITLPMATSSITLALGLFLQFKSSPLYFDATWILIVCAHVLISIPFALRTIMNSYNRIDMELINVAATLGASDWHIFRKIEWPLIKRGFLVGALFTFAISVGEFGATYFLARGENETLSVSISKLLITRNVQLPASMASILIIFCFLAFFIIQKLGDYQLKI